MRKILMSAVLLGTLASAAPAAAQYGQYRGNYGHGYNQGQNIPQQLANLSDRIDRLHDRRLISDREARRLSREVDQTDRLYDRYRRNGLNRGEYADLQNRIHYLRAEIREERQEGRHDRRYDRRY
jgi:hypothetical protein